jgi:nitrous oxide reductase accessory protein NosL
MHRLRTQILLVLTLTAVCFAAGCTRTKKAARPDPFTVVEQGMTEEDVLKLMGAPSKRIVSAAEGSPGSSQVNLRWITRRNIITITLVDGLVIGKRRF